jgi:co-chaperonin GroES (HSP10)
MKPLNDYIVVRKIQEAVKHSSGLMLSDEDVSELRYAKAEIEAVSEMSVSGLKAGDKIHYDKHSGFDMIIDGEKKTVIRERDVYVLL